MNPPKPILAPRAKPVPPGYLVEVRMLEERRRELGISQLDLEHRSGLHPGYWAHCLSPGTRHGRIARRKTLNKVFRVLFPPPAAAKGWRVIRVAGMKRATTAKRRSARARAGCEKTSNIADVAG
jgi:predicted transcriptional regulator